MADRRTLLCAAAALGLVVLGCSAAPSATPTRVPIIPTVDLNVLPRGPVGLSPSVTFTSGTRAVSLATVVVRMPPGGLDQVRELNGLAPDSSVVLLFPAPARESLAPPPALPDAVVVYVGVDGHVTAIQRPGDAPSTREPYQAVVVLRAVTPNLEAIQVGEVAQAPGVAIAHPEP